MQQILDATAHVGREEHLHPAHHPARATPAVIGVSVEHANGDAQPGEDEGGLLRIEHVLGIGHAVFLFMLVGLQPAGRGWADEGLALANEVWREQDGLEDAFVLGRDVPEELGCVLQLDEQDAEADVLPLEDALIIAALAREAAHLLLLGKAVGVGLLVDGEVDGVGRT